jgi:pyrroloquinoline quinone (PQQ) biosynthesis protein C
MAIELTPHPKWVEDLLESLASLQHRIVQHPYFEELGAGKLSIERFRWGLINFYPLVETFPKYMGLNLAKVPPGNAGWHGKFRGWLIKNMSTERIHAAWWRQWAKGFGVAPAALDGEIIPPPKMDAINAYLWRISTHGSLGEAMAATNYAVEGPTGEWTQRVSSGLPKYNGSNGVNVDDKTMQWVAGHAKYDDKHPYEALELIKACTSTFDEQRRVGNAARRAMEYYVIALDACYDMET